jgi:hypothetical protein
MNIHRHFKTIDDTVFLFNISYETEENLGNRIILKNFTIHPIVDGVVGPNCVKKELGDYTEYALSNILQILYNDGILP